MFRLAAFDKTRFVEPAGEHALVPPDSVSWRIFKNPVTLFIGGVAAVILELAEPAVRTGVWEHTDFRRDPMRRLERTGLAAMVTVYSARSVAEPMIAGVVRMHDRVEGVTPTGEPYRANDPKLLRWVQATAAYGFIEAYSRYGRALTPAEIDQAYAEGAPAAALYGAHDAPRSDAERQALFDAMRGRLEPSPILFEFLEIMRAAPIAPWPLRPVQWLLIRAAVDLTPGWVRERLGLGDALRSAAVAAAAGAAARRAGRSGGVAVQPGRAILPAAGPAGRHLYRRRGTG